MFKANRKIIKIINQITQVYDDIGTYYKYIELAGISDNNPELIQMITTNIKKSHDESKAYIKMVGGPSGDIDATIKNVFDISAYIFNNINSITDIREFFNNGKITTDQQNTTTNTGMTITTKYIKDITTKLNAMNDSIKILYNIYTEYTSLLLDAIINVMGDTIEDIILCIDIATDEYKKYMIIDIYTELLKYIITKTKHKKVIKHINKIFEQLKTSLMSTETNHLEHNRVNTLQTLIQAFGLIPYGEFVPLDVLFADMNLSTVDYTAFDKYCEHHNVGLLLIVKNTLYQPVEYNKWALIDFKYVNDNDLYTPKFSGIDERVIKRFNTIKYLFDVDDSIHSIDVKDGIYSFNPSAIYHVIETYDCKYFRFLSLYNDSKILEADRITPIIEGRVPSTRIIGYNEILSNTILEHVQIPVNTNDAPQLNIENIKYKIKNKFIDIINKFDDKKKIKKTLVSDKTIGQFMDIIFNMVVNSNESPELRISIMSEMQQFEKHLRKDLDKFLYIFDKGVTSPNINNYVTEIVNKNITKRKNIFRTLMGKNYIINKFY